MLNKKIITDEVINMLKPSIKKALIQTPIEHREDLEQELYVKIIKKIAEENPDNLPDFLDLVGYNKEVP